MTMKELEKRIAALEAQVTMLSGQLAARQQPIVLPAPSYPPYRQPWTITNDATVTTTNPRGSFRVVPNEESA